MIKYFLASIAIIVIFLSCTDNGKQDTTQTDTPEMLQHKKDERNKAVALQCIRAYQAHDSDFILAQNADTVVNIYSGKQPIHGIDSCRIVLRDAFNSFSYVPSKEHALADSNYVFVFLYVDGVLKKTSEAFHAKMVEIFKFNDDGKIVLHYGVYETLEPNDVRISL
jgi:hypothetical protein